MPYVVNEGVRIYYEVEGEGPALVLAPGMLSSLERWRFHGYTEQLRQDHQLVLLDPRGIGRSDKPHDPSAYRVDVVVRDLVLLLDELGIHKAIYWGYSAAAGVGYVLPKYLSSRLSALILGGRAPRFARTEQEQKMMNTLKWAIDLASDKGIEAFISIQKKRGAYQSEEEKEWDRRNDPLAQGAILTAGEENWPSWDEVKPFVQMPVLIYIGELDPFCASARDAASQIPGATFVALPGLDHEHAFARSDLVLSHVGSFLGRLTEGTSASATQGEASIRVG